MDEQSKDQNQYYKEDYPVDNTGKRTFNMIQIAGTLQKVTRPVFKQKSFSVSQIMSDWADIIGHHYGNLTVPYRLSNGTLTIACSSTTAAEMQYINNNIMQKINLYCGRALVKNIKYLSNRSALASIPKKPLFPKIPVKAIHIDNFPSGALQQALAKLGGNLQHKNRGK